MQYFSRLKNNYLNILFILIISLSISFPLAKKGLYTMHDDQQVARLYLFDNALKTGQFPPRWVDELGFGFGYPLFVFYPPLAYMLGEAFHFVGVGFIGSIKLVFFSSIVLSGLAMYVLVKELFGKIPATVASIFYILLPYRALDIYVRGALAESFAFVWPPLILWSFYKLTKTLNRTYLVLSSVFLAFLMITHNLIFMPFMLILTVYLAVLIVSDRKLLARRCQAIMGSIIFALCLSAFFWLPAILEKKYTLVDQLLLVNLANYKIHFVVPIQLWNWPWGFGGSANGLADGISFKIGKLHVMISLIAFFMAIIFWIKNSKLRLSTLNCQLSTVFFILSLFSAFMATSYSQFVWTLIPQLGYLQFPWRFLMFTGLFASIMAGSFIYFLKLPVLKLFASLGLLVLLFIPNFKLFKPQSYRSDITDQEATSKGTINWYVSSSSFEYIPKGVETYISDLGTRVAKIEKSDIPRQKIEILKGNAQIQIAAEKPSKLEFTTTSQSQSQIRINTFNFPGWQATIDSKSLTIDDGNRLKLITFSINEGMHKIKLEFKNTPAMSLANTISLLSILALPMFVKKWQI